MSDNGASSEFQLPIEQTATLRLLQVTDCHLFARNGDHLMGMDTDASLGSICRAIDRNEPNAAAVLATGDLSQDGSPESYQRLAQHLDGLARPVFWIPGNHDEIEAMRGHLQGQWIRPERSIGAGAWRIVLLDSTLPGEVHGRVSERELEFMHTSIEASREANVLICLHHQAMNVGSAWIDTKGLLDNETLRTEIERHDRVRAVVWGHVHQEFQQRENGIEWIATPSTCIQFAPGSAAFALDAQAPAYRVLDLHTDGRVETRVVRLAADDYTDALVSG